MKSRSIQLLYAVLIVAVAFWIWSQWSSDRRRIQRQLGRLQDLIEKTGDENSLTAANKARQVGNLMTREFEIGLEPYAGVVTDRARLSQVVLGYRDASSRIGLDFRDQELGLDETHGFADMTLVATVTGAIDGNSYRERYRLRLRWIEEEGEWLIQRVDLLEVLEGPQGLF